MKALREAFRSQMSALIEDITNAQQTLVRTEREFQLSESRIEEQKATIGHSREQLSQLRETGSAMEAKIAGLYNELSEHQQQIAVLKASIMEKSGRLESVEAEARQRTAALKSKQTLLEEKQKELGRLQANKDQELAKQKEELKAATKQVREVKKENPVADYLLAEAHEPPELGILAVLIHQKEVPLTELKRQAKSPPAITTRILKEMENKGILELSGSETARLLISV
jgi:chromosome segregation ATPase